MGLNCLVEPFECLVRVATKGADVGDPIRSSLLPFRDQGGEGGIGFGRAPERMVRHRQAKHPPELALFLLHLCERAGRIALAEQGPTEHVVIPAPPAQAQHRAAGRDRRVIAAGLELVAA